MHMHAEFTWHAWHSGKAHQLDSGFTSIRKCHYCSSKDPLCAFNVLRTCLHACFKKYHMHAHARSGGTWSRRRHGCKKGHHLQLYGSHRQAYIPFLGGGSWEPAWSNAYMASWCGKRILQLCHCTLISSTCMHAWLLDDDVIHQHVWVLVIFMLYDKVLLACRWRVFPGSNIDERLQGAYDSFHHWCLANKKNLASANLNSRPSKWPRPLVKSRGLFSSSDT